MVDSETDVEAVLKEHLDSSRWLVSSGAFERHGEICQTKHTSVNFSARITIEASRSQETAARKWPRTHTATPHRQLETEIAEDPFGGKPKYKFYDTSTEEKIACAACSKSGEVLCHECNGNGREICPNCHGSQFEIVSEPCPKCSDNREAADCNNCGGTGELRTEVPCSRCDGNGHTTCRECRGSGVADCQNCEGSGFLWEFELVTFDLHRKFRMRKKPTWWDSSTDEFVDELDLDGQKMNKKDLGENILQFETPEYRTVFTELKFGEQSYHAAIVYLSSDPTVVWDSKTSYPRTSLRRKLSDIKYRLFDD